MFDLSRRNFLKLARAGFLYLSGALALGGLLRLLDFESQTYAEGGYYQPALSTVSVRMDLRSLLSEVL